MLGANENGAMLGANGNGTMLYATSALRLRWRKDLGANFLAPSRVTWTPIVMAPIVMTLSLGSVFLKAFRQGHI
jgi:hypothetical protein